MRCRFIFPGFLIVLAFAILVVMARSPLGHSLMPGFGNNDSPITDSLRKSAYYRAALHQPVDSLCVVKHLRELYVFREGRLLKIYRIALGDSPAGHKHFEGDEKTPEGHYYINGKNPLSSCHKNLGISYPNAGDRSYARRLGKPPGGDIKIHGLPNGQGNIGSGHLLHDWTNGCIAVTDEEIDELYRYAEVGLPILITP